MARLGRFGAQLRSLLFKASVADEVDAELAFHIDMRARELEAEGIAPVEARRLAASRLGDMGRLKRSMNQLGEAREQTRGRRERFGELTQDLRWAVRQLTVAPAFAIVAVGTLALGIGGTTAIFSAVRAVILRPWPYAHPERTVYLSERWREQDESFSVGNFVDIRAMTTSFEALGAERITNFSLGDGDQPERVLGGRVSQGYFAVFGAPPLLGRVPVAEEDAPGREHVVVLAEGLWRRRYSADRAIVGRDIRINNVTYQVIGVMAESFDPSLSQEQLWVPIAFTPEQIAQHDEHHLSVFGLLKPAVSRERAGAELNASMAEVGRRFPREAAGHSVLLQPLGPFLLGNVGGQLWVLLGAVSLVLLIACGNVANLLLARASTRGREIAIRAAVGAGRGRIIRQLLTESLVLCLVASASGVALAAGLIRVLVTAAPAGVFPRLGETRIDMMVLGFALFAGLVATVVSGLLPALRAARHDLQGALRASGRGAGTHQAQGRLRSALVAGEVALALALLVGAGLLVRSAINLQRTPTGMDLAGVTAARLTLPAESYGDAQHVLQTFENITAAIAATPGVSQAAVVSVSPLSGNGGDNGLIPEGRPLEPASLIQSNLRLVTPGYFATVRVPLKKGRLFTTGDIAGQARVMIISERLAALSWPGQDPIGRRMICCEGSAEDPMWKTVVGVVGDVRSNGPMNTPGPEFYLPMRQAPHAAWTWNNRTMSIVVRSDAAPDVAASAIRAAVRAADPSLPLFSALSGDDLLARTLAPARFNTMLLGVLAALGLGLAVAGIYSVIAYFVTLRTHEIGVRMALGAHAADILRLMIVQGLRPVAAGLLLGMAGAWATTRFLRQTLFGVSATDPATFAVVCLLFAAIALVATVIPARRAARVNPTTALQQD